jgi:hypothetical protein
MTIFPFFKTDVTVSFDMPKILPAARVPVPFTVISMT